MSLWQDMATYTGGPAMRNLVVRMGVVCLLLGAGAVALHLSGWEVDKKNVNLRQELKNVPMSLGDDRWVARMGEDRTMNKEEIDVLGTDQYLLRRYRDKTKQDEMARIAAQGLQAKDSPEFHRAKVGETLSLNVNYYGTGGSDTHVPDVCWTGSGMERDFSDSGDMTIKDLVLADGSKIDVPLKLVAFRPSPEEMQINREWAGKENEHLKFVAYTFNVNGEYVAYRELLPQKFWFFSDYPFLFHTKIEVTVDERCSQAEARAALEPFFRAVMPEVLKCLPDVNQEMAKAAREKADKSKPAASQAGAKETNNSN